MERCVYAETIAADLLNGTGEIFTVGRRSLEKLCDQKVPACTCFAKAAIHTWCSSLDGERLKGWVFREHQGCLPSLIE